MISERLAGWRVGGTAEAFEIAADELGGGVVSAPTLGQDVKRPYTAGARFLKFSPSQKQATKVVQHNGHFGMSARSTPPRLHRTGIADEEIDFLLCGIEQVVLIVQIGHG